MNKLSIKKIFLLLVLSSIYTYGQGIIKGSVIDSLTMDQLRGAEIILTGTNFSTISNIDGEFKISGIPDGEYILQISYPGYKEKKISVNIKSEETLELNIELLPDIKVGNETILTDQAKSQAEEISLQLNSNIIKNVIGGNKLQNLPDENISTALNRLPGVSIIYKSFSPFNLDTWGSYSLNDYSVAIPLLPDGDIQIADDPVSRILIRGMDSKYSNITIDGIRLSPTSAINKSIDLNIFSERNFQNIELHKTITSDEDADATAGSINMLTGKAPNQRIIKARLFGNDNKLDKSTEQYNFTGSYSERFFGNLLGVQADAKAEKRILSNEYLSAEYNWGFALPTYTNVKREIQVANILLDYNTPDGGSIKFNNFFNNTNTDYFENHVSSVYAPGYIYSDRETEQRIFLSSIGGVNYLFGFNVDWNAAFSESRTVHPFDYSLVFIEGTPGRFTNTARYLEHTIDKSSKNYSKENTAFININKKYILSNEIAGELKFGGKYRINSRSYLEESRVENASLWGERGYRVLSDSSLVIKDFTGTRFDGLVGKVKWDIRLPYFQDKPRGGYNLFDEYNIPLINQDALRLWRSLTYNDYYANDGPDINSYNFFQSVFAGYVMHQLNFRQVAKFITGLRIEREQNNFRGYYFPYILDKGVDIYNNIPTQTNTYNYDKITLLPNFQMILKPADFLNLRLAAYKTLIRPDVTTRIPRFLVIIDRSGSSQYLNMGNPDLKNADVWNYEFQTQFYGNDIGQFSINAFYKDIKGMQQATSGISLFSGQGVTDSLGINWNNMPRDFPFSSSANTIYSLHTYFNLPKPTRIWGFEIEHQANFRYLPGLLKNIILNYNLTFLRSETWRFDSFEIGHTRTRAGSQFILSYKKLKLSDTPEFFANVNLGYNIGGFSFRISYFYQDGYPIYDIQNYRGQIVENRFSRLDFALKQQISENLSFIVNLNNITDSKEEFVNNYDSREDTPAQIYRNGMNIDFGIGIDL